jgi:hypothetical protein
MMTLAKQRTAFVFLGVKTPGTDVVLANHFNASSAPTNRKGCSVLCLAASTGIPTRAWALCCLSLPAQPVKTESREAPMSNRNGFVYLIKSGHFYKIGCTINIERRMADFSPVLLPFPLILIHSIKCSDRFYAESYLHKQYASCRMNGEWFKLNQKQVKMICSILEIEPDGIYYKGQTIWDEPNPDLEKPIDNAEFIDYLESEDLAGFLA